MKSTSQPTPPDPTATAAAQTASNQQTAQYQAGLNMVDQSTPLGSLTYQQVSPGDGNTPPHYSATTTLSPTGQKSFDLQQQTGEALDNLALAGTGNVSSAMAQPQSYAGLPSAQGFDLSSLPGYDASSFKAPTASDADYKQAQDALYGQFTSRLDPQWQQQEKDLSDKLSQQGVLQGSDAYNTAMSQFQQGKTDAYQTAQNNATTGATGIEQAQFGMGQQSYQDLVANALNANQTALTNNQAVQASQTGARQQGITESNYLRELPINEVSSLLNGGQVSQPTFQNTPQTAVGNTNVAGIVQNSFQDAESNYQTATSANNAAIGAVFGAAGSALGGWATGGFA